DVLPKRDPEAGGISIRRWHALGEWIAHVEQWGDAVRLRSDRIGSPCCAERVRELLPGGQRMREDAKAGSSHDLVIYLVGDAQARIQMRAARNLHLLAVPVQPGNPYAADQVRKLRDFSRERRRGLKIDIVELVLPLHIAGLVVDAQP